MPDPALDNLPLLEMVDGVPVVRLMATHRLLDHAIDAATVVIRRMVEQGQPHLLLPQAFAGTLR